MRGWRLSVARTTNGSTLDTSRETIECSRLDAGLDPLDVLAAIGALQLLPENVDALFRLEAAAGVASTVAPFGAGTAIPDEASRSSSLID